MNLLVLLRNLCIQRTGVIKSGFSRYLADQFSWMRLELECFGWLIKGFVSQRWFSEVTLIISIIIQITWGCLDFPERQCSFLPLFFAPLLLSVLSANISPNTDFLPEIYHLPFCDSDCKNTLLLHFIPVHTYKGYDKVLRQCRGVQVENGYCQPS